VPHDVGLHVAPHFRESPLSLVSDRALRVYLVLASLAAHTDCKREVDGMTIPLSRGETLQSYRVLTSHVRGGRSRLMHAVRELEAAGLVTVQNIERPERAVPNQDRQRSQAETAPRSQSRTAGKTLLSRFKVHGIKHLPRNMSGPHLRPIQVQAERLTPLSPREVNENARAFAILSEEGR
jgi:hypothetical protein